MLARRIASVAIFCLIGLLPLGSSSATENLPAVSARVLTVVAGHGNQLHAIELDDGDLVPHGSRIRLVLRARANTTVDISYTDSDQKVRVLATNKKLSAGEAIYLPGKRTWYAIEGGDGAETFRITERDKTGNLRVIERTIVVTDADAVAIPRFPENAVVQTPEEDA